MASVNVDSSKFLPTGVKLRESCSDPILLKMLEEGLLADITLKAKWGSVKAHKSVLASVSPVFCAMFQHMMKEKLTCKGDFFEMTIDALQLFLLLLYTTNEEDTRPQRMQSHFNDATDKYFVEIFDAACKYQVGRRLGCVLRSALLRKLKPENCWYYLDCSKELGSQNLMELMNIVAIRPVLITSWKITTKLSNLKVFSRRCGAILC